MLCRERNEQERSGLAFPSITAAGLQQNALLGLLDGASVVTLPCAPYLLAPRYDNAQKYWKKVSKKSHSEKFHLSCIAKFLKYGGNLLLFYTCALISPEERGWFLSRPRLDAIFNEDTTTPSLIGGEFSFLGDSPLPLQKDRLTGTKHSSSTSC